MKWKDLGLLCDNCGKPIESKPDFDNCKSFVLTGYEPMRHRHIHDKKESCAIEIVKAVKPYSDCGKRELYYKALESEQ